MFTKAITDVHDRHIIRFFSRYPFSYRRHSPSIWRTLTYLCLKNPLPDDNSSQTYNAVEGSCFRYLHTTLVTLLTALLSPSLVLMPAGISYLMGLRRPFFFAVVVIFGVVFAHCSLLLHREPDWPCGRGA
ncbi:hypothetical protein F4680DRAFT_399509 [Xylaria scruposa]|nr:hypothetical protein F4680DRAFT_399509 [Xylaria scruposa]